jgi:hypothetical protein
MFRAAAFVLTVCALVASGFGYVNDRNSKPKGVMEAGPGREAARELDRAGRQLYLTKQFADTYNGPDLKNFRDLQLIRADHLGFCIQAVKGAQVFRLLGPGGKPEPGRC